MATKKAAPEKVIAFKAFDPDFSCRGFKYEVGKTYKHEGPVKLCETGFHACKEPLEVWRFYDLINGDGGMTRYAEVEMSGVVDEGGADTKIAAAEITIKAELKLPDFIKRAVDVLIAACKPDEKVQAASGDSSKLAASGYSSKLAADGEKSVIAASAPGCTARGKDGTWISLAEFNDKGECVGFATGCIGKDGLKADTWYIARNGKLQVA